MTIRQFMNEINEAHYVYFDRNTDMFFQWNGLDYIKIRSSKTGEEIIFLTIPKSIPRKVKNIRAYIESWISDTLENELKK